MSHFELARLISWINSLRIVSQLTQVGGRKKPYI